MYKFLVKKNKLVLLLGCIFILLVISGAYTIYLFTANSQKIEGATWEVYIEYDRDSGSLHLKKLDFVEEIITQDDTQALNSEYLLSVLDDAGLEIYSKSILINTANNYNVLAYPLDGSSSADFSIPEQPEKLETLLFVPYFKNSKEIVIYKNQKVALQIKLPKKDINLSGTQIAQSCNQLTTVFVSDGYSDMNFFRRDVDWITGIFLSVEPFRSKKESFDFKILENTIPLGCVQSYSCTNKSSEIRKMVAAVYPNAKKIIVLINRPITTPADGSVAGVNTPYVSYFSNASDGLGRNIIPAIAAHEFLGHAVSGLDERYVNVGSGQTGAGPNCSTIPGGKSFWKNAGVTTTYPGCAYENFYAPGPLDCPAPLNPNLFSGGTSASAMSAAGCGAPQFDTVEKYWIENNILPAYSVCSNPTASLAPTITAEISVPPTNTPICNPDGIEGIGFADLRLARQEIAGIVLTNNAACMTGNAQTSFSDLRKIRQILAGIEPN